LPDSASQRRAASRSNVARTTEFGDGEHTQRPHRPLAPTIATLGRYLLEERIGSGGMGEVFRARDPDLDRAIAIKRLVAYSDDDEARIRLAREGQAIARLSHVNVVQVYDVGRDPVCGDMFIAMELVEGLTLRQWLRTDRHWREIADVFVQAGTGLLAAHRQGIVHRDFKPENVLIAEGPVAKVADFGLAKAATDDDDARMADGGLDDDGPSAADDPPSDAAPAVPSPAPRGHRRSTPGRRDRSSVLSGSSGSAFDSALTPVGARLGTPAYMAPEQASGLTTPRADQFSFAVALFEALCGYLPFLGEGPGPYAVAVLEGSVLEFPRNTLVPKRLQLAVYRALEADPASRFDSVEPLLAELRRDPTATRRRAVRLGGTLVLGGAVTLLGAELARTGDGSTRACDSDAAIIDTVWNGDVRAALTDSMAAIDASFAADTAERVASALDRTSTAWVDLRRRWCESSAAERTPVAVGAAIGACTERMLSRERELVASLLDADPEVLAHALDAIERLERELGRCEDPLFLSHYAGTGSDAERHDALEVLAQARQRLALGQSAAGLRMLDGLMQRADPQVALEHNLLRAGLERLRGNFTDARALLEQAAHEGLGADAPLLAAEWNTSYSDLLNAMGDLDAMGPPAERAWTLRRRFLGDDHVDTLVAQAARGHLPYARGEYEQALRIYAEVAQRAAASLPDDDIDRVLLDEWVAQSMAHTGDLDGAIHRTADLVSRLERTRGRLHPRTLDLLETQAMAELRAGRNAEALAHFRAALDGRAPVADGGDPLARGYTLANVGASLSAVGRDDEAVAALTEALALWRGAGFGPRHASVIAIEGNLAGIHHRGGRLDLALEMFDRTIENMHTAGLELTSNALMIHLNYARALEDAGRRDEATAALGAVVERAAAGNNPVILGRAAHALAVALDATGERGKAEGALTTAAAAFAEQPVGSPWRAAFEAYRRGRTTGR